MTSEAPHLISCTAHHTCSYPVSRPFPCVLPELAGTHDLAAHKIVGNNQASHFLASQLLLPKIDDTKLPLSLYCQHRVLLWQRTPYWCNYLFAVLAQHLFICPCGSAHKALIVWAEVGLESGIAQALRNTHSNSPTLYSMMNCSQSKCIIRSSSHSLAISGPAGHCRTSGVDWLPWRIFWRIGGSTPAFTFVDPQQGTLLEAFP